MSNGERQRKFNEEIDKLGNLIDSNGHVETDLKNK